MGSSGWSLPLTRIAGRKQATNAGVRSAIVDTLGEIWYRDLSSPWDRKAREFIFLGEDSLLTVQDRGANREVPTQLTFWFYESVSWAQTLAEHWLKLALARRRPQFEHALAKLGFAIAAEHWPSVLELTAAKQPRFFEHDDKIGYVSGKQVHWELAAEGQPEPIAIAKLPREARDKLAVLEKRCACPMCERMHDELHPAFAVDKGHRIERIGFADWYMHAVAPRSGGTLATCNSDSWTWTTRSDGSSPPWTTIPTLTDDKRRIDLIHEVGDSLVAILGYSSPKPARVATVSRDGGATWSEPEPTGLPELRSPSFLVSPHRPEVVYVHPRGKSTLYRSNDGGRTFGKPVDPKIDGQPVADVWEVVAFGDKRLIAGYSRKRKSPSALAASDDGGKTFTTIPLGDVVVNALWGTASGTIVALGKSGETPVLLRSQDEGVTWSSYGRPAKIDYVSLGGRWFVVESDVGVHVSDDEGATWARVATGTAPFQGLFADGADPSSVYLAVGGLLVRLVIGKLAPKALPGPKRALPPEQAMPKTLAAKRVTKPKRSNVTTTTKSKVTARAKPKVTAKARSKKRR